MRLGDIRRRILSEHGVEIVRAKHKRAVRQATPPLSSIPRKLKTEKMRLLELDHGKGIEEILTDGSLSTVSSTYNISVATVIKWKKLLNLNYSPDNLPSCINCASKSVVCQTTGYCHVLFRAKADLATTSAKELEVLNQS